MKISDNGIKFIANWEGKRNSTYLDAVGLPTIGIGHLIKKGESFPKPLTDKEVYDLFRKDIIGFENTINSSVKVKLTQNQFDALVSFAFNVGVGAFLQSTLLKLLNKSDYKGASEQFLRWNKGGGRVILGLTNRRTAEKNLFNKV